MALRADTTPLRESPAFRALFASRTITLIGSEATAVALLVQAKDLTGSALAVGLLGVAEVIPLILAGLYGGLLADRLDRRAIARASEAGLAVLTALLAVNAALPDPMLWPLYAGAAAIMALVALQRPSLDAAVPRVVERDQLTAASAIMGLAGNAAFIARRGARRHPRRRTRASASRTGSTPRPSRSRSSCSSASRSCRPQTRRKPARARCAKGSATQWAARSWSARTRST